MSENCRYENPLAPTEAPVDGLTLRWARRLAKEAMRIASLAGNVVIHLGDLHAPCVLCGLPCATCLDTRLFVERHAERRLDFTPLFLSVAVEIAVCGDCGAFVVDWERIVHAPLLDPAMEERLPRQKSA